MYGLIRTLGNQLKSSPQEQSQREKNVQSPVVEINYPEGNGPEWFMGKGSLWFSQRARFHEGERESIC